MKKQHYLGCLVGLITGVIVLRVLGVSLGVLAVVLACPLMMFFMMRAMGGTGQGTRDSGDSRDRDGQDSAR
jgi:hypothetical protein